MFMNPDTGELMVPIKPIPQAGVEGLVAALAAKATTANLDALGVTVTAQGVTATAQGVTLAALAEAVEGKLDAAFASQAEAAGGAAVDKPVNALGVKQALDALRAVATLTDTQVPDLLGQWNQYKLMTPYTTNGMLSVLRPFATASQAMAGIATDKVVSPATAKLLVDAAIVSATLHGISATVATESEVVAALSGTETALAKLVSVAGVVAALEPATAEEWEAEAAEAEWKHVNLGALREMIVLANVAEAMASSGFDGKLITVGVVRPLLANREKLVRRVERVLLATDATELTDGMAGWLVQNCDTRSRKLTRLSLGLGSWSGAGAMPEMAGSLTHWRRGAGGGWDLHQTVALAAQAGDGPWSWVMPGGSTVGFTSWVVGLGPDKTITAVNTATEVFTCVGHGLTVEDRVIWSLVGAGALPTGISDSQVYWVVPVDADTFKVSLTKNGAAVNVTGAGSGTRIVNAMTHRFSGAVLLNGDEVVATAIPAPMEAGIVDDTGLVEGETYYVVDAVGDSCSLSATVGGAPVPMPGPPGGGSSSGAVATLTQAADWVSGARLKLELELVTASGEYRTLNGAEIEVEWQEVVE
jgi:hypothetical protein